MLCDTCLRLVRHWDASSLWAKLGAAKGTWHPRCKLASERIASGGSWEKRRVEEVVGDTGPAPPNIKVFKIDPWPSSDAHTRQDSDIKTKETRKLPGTEYFLVSIYFDISFCLHLWTCFSCKTHWHSLWVIGAHAVLLIREHSINSSRSVGSIFVRDMNGMCIWLTLQRRHQYE